MKEKLQTIYKTLDWLYDRMDELQERINDYIFTSGCDIDSSKADQKILRAFDKECDELEARYDKELREIQKLAGKEE
jgi:hypothetical protein